MRVLVCGGRDFRGYDQVFAWLDRWEKATIGGITIIHGDNRGGADMAADVWAVLNGKRAGRDLLRYPADWNAYGNAAGPRRNTEMIEQGRPDKVLAFPGGSGTADLRRKAGHASIPVIEG